MPISFRLSGTDKILQPQRVQGTVPRFPLFEVNILYIYNNKKREKREKIFLFLLLYIIHIFLMGTVGTVGIYIFSPYIYIILLL